MGKKKDLNKIIIGIFLGSAIGGLGFFSRTKKGKSFIKKVKDDINLGINEMKKVFGKVIKKNDKEKS